MITNNTEATKFRMRGLLGDEALLREEKADRKARDCERQRRPIYFCDVYPSAAIDRGVPQQKHRR